MAKGKDSTRVREQIVDVALRQLGDAAIHDLFKATTPELLAAGSPWAASTVRYQFGHASGQDQKHGRLSFQRRDLALAMLDAALRDAVTASEHVAERYADAAQELPEQRSMDVVLEAIAQNLDAFTPGATAEDIAPRERMYYVALSICDDDPDAARLLRAARSRQIACFTPIYAAFMTSLGRELRPGRTIEELAGAIYALLDGHLARLRFDPRTPADWVGDAVGAIFTSFTVPIGEPPIDPLSSLLGAPDPD